MKSFKFGQLQQVELACADDKLVGDLYLSLEGQGLVIFAHGSGSSRLSPRNKYVAEALNQLKLSTLLLDLLTSREDQIDQLTVEYRFNIPLLAERLVCATKWILQQPVLAKLNIGYFGASTGAAAALIAASQQQSVIKAIVSRGGRPDLAADKLSAVTAPTLLIVGELDEMVIDLNQQAQAKMTNVNQLAIVPGATHLFEEPGALDQVNQLAGEWFIKYLVNNEQK